ncbi:MAG: ABC transporter permease [Pseudomonadota bacterium]|nr:ABC transporter permease [Pseudomonadota bacterium]
MELIWDSLPRMMTGALLTIELTALSVALGLCLAVPLAMLYLAKNPVLSLPVRTYVFYFRGTPLLVQIFLIYYGSGQFRDALEEVGLWTFFREPYFCAVLSLTLNTAAYTAYILRGAITNVSFGEVEAARACGMSRALLYRRIILPSAFRLALPSYTNEVVFLFQATSLVSIISLLDLTGVARIIVARSFEVYDIYITAAVLYLIGTYAMLWGFRKLEHWWSGHLRVREDNALAIATEGIQVR